MSVYEELDLNLEHRTQFALKGKREHIAKINMPNIAYPNQHIDIEIPHGSRNHVTIPDKARSIVNNVGRALMKKKVLILGSKEINTINNADVFDTYKDLYLSAKEREEKLLQGIQSANGLKARVGDKKADGTALAVTNYENGIKKTFDKRFAIPLKFDFFKHLVHPYGLKADLFVRLELNSSAKVILATGDTSTTCKLSDISV